MTKIKAKTPGFTRTHANHLTKTLDQARRVDLIDLHRATDVVARSDEFNNVDFLHALSADSVHAIGKIITKSSVFDHLGNVRDNSATNITLNNNLTNFNGKTLQELLDHLFNPINGSMTLDKMPEFITVKSAEELAKYSKGSISDQLTALVLAVKNHKPIEGSLAFIGYDTKTKTPGRHSGVWIYHNKPQGWVPFLDMAEVISSVAKNELYKITKVTPAITATLAYEATAVVDLFLLRTPDMHNKSYTLDNNIKHPMHVYVNGTRLVQNIDFTVDYATSEVHLTRFVPVGSITQIDILQDPNMLMPIFTAVVPIDKITILPGVTTYPLVDADTHKPVFPTSPADLLVVMDKQVLDPNTDYTVKRDQLIFHAGLPLTNNVWVSYFDRNGVVGAGTAPITPPTAFANHAETKAGVSKILAISPDSLRDRLAVVESNLHLGTGNSPTDVHALISIDAVHKSLELRVHNQTGIEVYSDRAPTTKWHPTEVDSLVRKDYVDARSRTLWEPARDYFLGDVVSFGGSLFYSLADHTASTTVPQADAAHWLELELEYRGREFAPAKGYTAGDIVTSNDVAYVCIVTHTALPGNPATDITNWRVLVPEEKGGVAFDAATDYITGDLVTSGGGVAIALRPSKGSIPGTDPLDWEVLGGGNTLEAYTTGNDYAIGDQVEFDNKIWEAIVDITTAAAIFDPTQWAAVVGDVDAVIVHKGLNAPLDTMGENGDMYFRYTEAADQTRLFDPFAPVDLSLNPLHAELQMAIVDGGNIPGVIFANIKGYAPTADDFCTLVLTLSNTNEVYATLITWNNQPTDLQGLMDAGYILEVNGAVVPLTAQVNLASTDDVLAIDSTIATSITNVSFNQYVLNPELITAKLSIVASNGALEKYQKLSGTWVSDTGVYDPALFGDAWDAGTDYLVGDITTVLGVVYIALTNNLGKDPTTERADWVLAFKDIVGKRGPEGAEGPEGPQGVAGVSLNVLPPVADNTARDALSTVYTVTDAGAAVLTVDTGTFWVWDGPTLAWMDASSLVGPAGTRGLTGAQGVAGAVSTVAGPAGKDGMRTRVTGGTLYITTDGSAP